MGNLRRFVLPMIVAAGAVVLPAERSEAGLIDWLRCVLNPCRWPCDPCAPSCEIPSCPPTVVEGSYCDPCSTCTTSYVRRSYVEPRTRMTKQFVLEPTPTFVRRRYWDPCALRYRTSCEPTTSYVRRAYCCPVTEYVERSYYEPVTTCTTPACPTPACEVTSPVLPAEPSGMPPLSNSRLNRPLVRGSSSPRVNSPSTTFPNPIKSHAPAADRPASTRAPRPALLAIADGRTPG